ncbi:MAG TPA: MATE family efflux transporter, partial [Trichococcus flocculiformis]|nr:MATE family efflux transporter [Trichococcus flocculiformis]
MGEEKQADIKQPKSPINKEIMNIAWPVLIELVLSSLFGMINMMMLGNIADHAYAAAAVSAVGVTNQPLFLGLAVVQALNVGGTALIARYFGAGKHDRMENVMKHVMIISMILSAPLALAAFVYSDQIMTFMGAQSDTVEIGRLYFRLICISYLFQSFNFSISGSLRGIGETQIPMGVNLRANFLNVIGNALLIYGLFGLPAFGITGAALSTVGANLVASFLLIRYLRSGKSKLNFSFAHPFQFSMKTMKSLAKIGLPSALEQLALRSGMI